MRSSLVTSTKFPSRQTLLSAATYTANQLSNSHKTWEPAEQNHATRPSGLQKREMFQLSTAYIVLSPNKKRCAFCLLSHLTTLLNCVTCLEFIGRRMVVIRKKAMVAYCKVLFQQFLAVTQGKAVYRPRFQLATDHKC